MGINKELFRVTVLTIVSFALSVQAENKAPANPLPNGDFENAAPDAGDKPDKWFKSSVSLPEQLNWELEKFSGDYKEFPGRDNRVIVLRSDPEHPAGWFSAPVKVLPGREYVLTFRAKYASASSPPGFCMVEAESAKPLPATPVTPIGTSWNRLYQKMFKTGNSDTVTIHFQLFRNSKPTEMKIDTVSLDLLPTEKYETGKGVFREDFSKFTRWRVLVGSRNYWKIENVDGKPALNFQAPGDGIISAEWDSAPIRNCLISLEFQIVKLGTGRGRPSFKCRFGRDRNTSYGIPLYITKNYSALVLSRNYLKHFQHLTSASVDRLIGGNLKPGRWYKLSYRLAEGHITVKIDGKTVIDFHDAEKKYEAFNNIILGFNNLTCRVRDLSVTPLHAKKETSNTK